MPPRPRVVVPEILDGLPHDDPDAVATRRDLRRVNAVMGNPRWILRQARAHPDIARQGITEIGAGDGRLAMRLAGAFPDTRVTAIDLAPAPPGVLPPNLDWRQSDLFDEAADLPTGGLLVACLILHHFEAPALATLGRQFLSRFDALAIVEPDRRTLAHHLGRLAWPFINRVTRHDMHVSIDAGFARGELAELLGLDTRLWRIEESCTLTGARRLFVCKHSTSRSLTPS
jgi:hypothetical protein